MVPRLRFEDRFFPLVTVAFCPEGCSDEDVEHMLSGFERVQARGRRYTALIDGAGIAAAPNARQRRRLADWEAERAPITTKLNMGTGLVVDSAIARGAIAAIRWITRATTKEVVFANPAEAGLWCLAQLDASKIVVPIATRQLVASLALRGSAALRSREARRSDETYPIG